MVYSGSTWYGLLWEYMYQYRSTVEGSDQALTEEHASPDRCLDASRLVPRAFFLVKISPVRLPVSPVYDGGQFSSAG